VYDSSDVKPNLLVQKTFETPVGAVTCGISSNRGELELLESRRDEKARESSATYLTNAHQIELLESEGFVRPRFLKSAVSSSRTWAWTIRKVFDFYEELSVSFRLIPAHRTIDGHFATANDYVDVLEASRDDCVLYLGKPCDDEIKEMMADSGCLMKIVQEKADFYSSFTFTKEEQNGVRIPIPFLARTEFGALHFKFVAACGDRTIKADNTLQILLGLF
jgi:hypothetical protein